MRPNIPGIKWSRVWATVPKNDNWPVEQRYDVWLVKPHRRCARLVHLHHETRRWKYPNDSEWRD